MMRTSLSSSRIRTITSNFSSGKITTRRRRRRFVSKNFFQNYADNINLRAAKNFFVEKEIEMGISKGKSMSICDNIRQECEFSPPPQEELTFTRKSSPKEWVIFCFVLRRAVFILLKIYQFIILIFSFCFLFCF